MTRHERIVALICTAANGVQPLRQVSAIPDGYMKNRSQIWRLSVLRAQRWDAAGLIRLDHRPGYGTFGSGSIRTKSKVWATPLGRLYVRLCHEASRLSNLSWPDEDYDGYATWQNEWLDRRASFERALRAMDPGPEA
jgi:hypothetical protein